MAQQHRVLTTPTEACSTDLLVGCRRIGSKGLDKVKDAGCCDRRTIEDFPGDKARECQSDIVWLPQGSIDTRSHDVVHVTHGRRAAAIA